jgi:molybdopterin/thiamine biosynthesis adenylyltransferase
MSEHARDPLSYSRPLATAARLGDDAPDRHRFLEKHVILTGDPAILATPNGRLMALTALRLLPRLTPHVTVWLPGAPATLVDELAREGERIAFGGRVLVHTDATPLDDDVIRHADAVLSVGAGPRRATDAESRDGILDPAAGLAERWTTIASNGWCTWVARGPLPTAVSTTQANPIGAVFAASLGVAEVFKVLIVLKSERGAPADGTPFSLLTYRAGDGAPGPALPDLLDIDALLVGVGAIGNGIVAVLAEFTLAGRVVVIDRQTYGPENLGTCILVGPKDLGTEKPMLARRALAHLAPGLEVDPRFGDAEELLSAVRPAPAVILNGLDSREARRAAQRLWVDVTVDGAIGDFMCQVSCHPGDPNVDTACLRCLFAPETGPRADEVAAAASGLRIDRVNVDDVVREEDVLAAPEEHREALRTQVGRPICSVTSEAVARAISAVEQRKGFEPSVPFVATCSAAMVVGEWVKAVTGLPSTLDPRFQFDVLHGPAAGSDFPESRHADCECVQRRGVIAQFRAARHASNVAPVSSVQTASIGTPA